jgi:crotonobetainyl-CoA:carnitine CoA-transferase CaiB-like acyl-CoA transferase
MGEDAPGPLSRFTVLEVNDDDVPTCLRLAASLATRIAVDLGATVVKIEPPGGDPVRRLPPRLPRGPNAERSALFQFLNGGKRSLVLDLATPHGRETAMALTGKADAVVFESPSRIAGSLREIAPAAIEIAAFPLDMDIPLRPVSEFTIAALAGPLHMVGEPDRQPLRLGGHQVSYAAGLTAFTGLMAALAARGQDRKVPEVRVSLAEVAQWVNWKAASSAHTTGQSPGREGRQSEFQIVRCADGYVAVVFTVTQWPPLRELIGDPRLAEERFATRAGRRRHVDALYAILRPWFAGKTRREVQHLAQAKGVPFGPVFSPAELLETEQYQARGFLAELNHPTLGLLRLPRLPVQWNGRSFSPRIAPALADPLPRAAE